MSAPAVCGRCGAELEGPGIGCGRCVFAPALPGHPAGCCCGECLAPLAELERFDVEHEAAGRRSAELERLRRLRELTVGIGRGRRP